MRKWFLVFVAGLFFVTMASFATHKFYVAIYQIHFAPEKKMLQITSRIFIDDLNEVLSKKYHKKTQLGEKTESPEDVALMQKYLAEKFSIKINGKPKTPNYLSREFENNVIICYFNIKEITEVRSLEIKNEVLTDLFPDQQNIIQASVLGEKQGLLLSESTQSGTLNFK